MCEVCGRQRRAQLKGRDICRACLRTEPGARCVRCGHVKHYVDEQSGLWPRRTPVMAPPGAICTRCSPTGAIYNQKQQLCKESNQYARHHARSKEREVKVNPWVFGEGRPS